MTDLRTAATQALEALEDFHTDGYRRESCYEIIKALKSALAEPAEPVAWRTFDGEGGYDYRDYDENENYAAEWAKRNPNHAEWVEPLYTAPVQAAPIAWMVYTEGGASAYITDNPTDLIGAYRALPLYTSAPTPRKPLRTVTYVCPACHFSLERQE